MSLSRVAHIKVVARNKQEFLENVKRVMELANWKKYVKGNKIFLKINLLSDQVVPGQCTSPWVLEGVIKTIKESMNAEIMVGDAEVATQKQVDKASILWGVRDICRRYGIKFINLSKEPTTKVDLGGEIFGEMNIPKILLDADTIITIPVLKTHNVTAMTFALKNQWGCLPKVRHQYHLVAHKAIPEINRFLRPSFAVGDATICLEGNGPRTGKPRIVNSLLASNDLVAMDVCGAKIIGYKLKEVPYIKIAEEMGIGTTKFKLVGDEIKTENFERPVLREHPIVYAELILRKIPGINKLFFETPLFKLASFFASRYNAVWWYNREGKKYAREMLKHSALYREEFERLIE